MRYIWEREDLGWGRYVTKQRKKVELQHIWKLGGNGCNPTLTCMSDGFVVEFKGKDKLIEHLNNNTHGKNVANGFKPTNMEEMFKLIKESWEVHERNR